MIRTLWWFDAMVAAVVCYFFVIGLADGSVSAFNGGLWAVILGALAVILAGSRVLVARGHSRAATALLLVLAVPGALAALFFLLIIITQPRWN